MNADAQSPIAIIGNLNVDQIVSTVTRFPQWDEELIVDSSRLELAGTAGYVALAAKGLEIPPFVVSTVGNDLYADFLRDELAAARIDDRGVLTIESAPTCIGIVFVGGEGQRGILSVLGAHRMMNVDVALRFDHRIAQCPEVFLCGNYLLPECSPSHVLDYATNLRQRGQRVVFDPGWDPAGWAEQTRVSTFAFLNQVDLYMPNEEEICHLTGTATWREAAEIVAPLTYQTVIKRGAGGAVYVSGNTIIEVSALPIDPVNTIGAGDVFDVGFLYAGRLGWPIEQCLRFACDAAAYVVAQRGPRDYPDQRTVEAFANRMSN